MDGVKVKILICGLYGDGLAAILRGAGVEVVSEGADVIVMDGADSPTEPGVRRLILTNDTTGLVEVMRAGGIDGCIPHTATGAEFAYAARIVGRGDLYVHPNLIAGMIGSWNGTSPPQQKIDWPTPREMDILRLLARGYKNREMAEALGVSTRTIESHRQNVRGKLGLKERWELVEWWEGYGEG